MSELSDEATILIVDSLPLRNLGLVTLLDRLSGTTKFRLASLTPDNAERWIDGATHCSMIIYNVGGASVGDHKHLKRIKGLRARAGEAPLVILSDNDSREEILSAMGAGAQGFLYAGTNAQLALQALSFIFKGGSYFPTTARAETAQLHSPEWNVGVESLTCSVHNPGHQRRRRRQRRGHGHGEYQSHGKTEIRA